MADDDRPPIDAVRFVALTEGLRAAFSRVGKARLSDPKRIRWQQRLVAITDAARRDLGAAQAKLDRYDEHWRREVG